MSEPQPPTDVQVKLKDGSWLPLRVKYRGLYDGFHDWLALIPEGADVKLPMEPSVGEMPGRYQLTYRFDER